MILGTFSSKSVSSSKRNSLAELPLFDNIYTIVIRESTLLRSLPLGQCDAQMALFVLVNRDCLRFDHLACVKQYTRRASVPTGCLRHQVRIILLFCLWCLHPCCSIDRRIAVYRTFTKSVPCTAASYTTQLSILTNDTYTSCHPRSSKGFVRMCKWAVDGQFT